MRNIDITSHDLMYHNTDITSSYQPALITFKPFLTSRLHSNVDNPSAL